MEVLRRQTELLWLAGSILLAALLGVAIVHVGPLIAVVPLVGVAALTLVTSRWFRVPVVIFGGLLAFQTEAMGLKAAYVAVLALAAGVVLFEYARSERQRRVLGPLILAAPVVLAAVAISYLRAGVDAHAQSDWLRDSLPYLMLAVAPVIALDVSKLGHRAAVGLLLAAGALATFNFTAEWLTRREYAAVPHVGLSSLVLSAAVFSYLSARALDDHRWRWALAASVVLAALLLTGTRSALLIALAPAVVAFAPGIGSPRRLGQLVLLAALVVGVAWSVLTLAGQQEALERLTGHGGVASEVSVMERSAAREQVMREWERSPWLGVGAGQQFAWPVPYPPWVKMDFTADTALTTLAKYGWIGGMMLFGYVAVCLLSPLRVDRRDAAAALAGLAGFLAVYGLTASPLEDKGLAFALMLLLGITASPRAEQP